MEILKKIINLLIRKIKKEKFLSFFIVFLIFSLIILSILSDKFLIEIPKEGGVVNEVVIKDKPRFINPVLGISNIDKSLISLIYSPLFKTDNNGDLIENIASYKINNTGKTYSIKLKKGIKFSDEQEMTTDDIIYTIEQIQNPKNNSFYRPEWVGIKLKKIDNYNLDIILPKVNYYFKKSLSLYILPKHIWKNIEYFNLDDRNLNPIGSGPFQIQEIKWENDEKNKRIESIRLIKNESYWKGRIFLNEIKFNFFETQNTFLNSSLDPNIENINIFNYDQIKELEKKFYKKEINELVNFKLTIKNNNSNKFLNIKKIRKYIFDSWNSKNKKELTYLRKDILEDKNFNYDEENNLLKYKKEIISFSVLTGINQDESLLKIAEKLKNKLRISGVNINLKKASSKDFITKYRNRNFESIISGYHDDEKYLFYYHHSSQKNDPGTNIAQFNSQKINNLIIDLTKNLPEKDRKLKKEELNKEIKNYYLILDLKKNKSFYYLSKNIDNLDLEKINSGENRFWNIQNWVVLKEKVLPILKK